MKIVRFLPILLLLLATLLPFRVALAEVAQCTGTPNGQVQVDHDHAHSADHVKADDALDTTHQEYCANAADECRFCPASFSSAAFLSAQLKVAAPVVLVDAQFAPFKAPPPRNAAERQERPPRSI